VSPREDQPNHWQTELVREYEMLAKDLARYRLTTDPQILVYVLREAARVLRRIAEDNELWQWIDVAVVDATTTALGDEFQGVLVNLNEILWIEADVLVAAGVSPVQAEEMLADTKDRIGGYLDLASNGQAPNSEEVRRRISQFGEVAEGAQAVLQATLDRGTPKPTKRRGLRHAIRTAVRSLDAIGGVVEIVADVAAAHVTFGVTAVSVLDGIARAGKATSESDG
jgi:aminopeptidase N